MKEIVGNVTEVESKEIEEIFEKKIALQNLLKLVQDEKSILFKRIQSDYESTCKLFEYWWHEKSTKYDWKIREHDTWHIDFITCEIYFE